MPSATPISDEEEVGDDAGTPAVAVPPLRRAVTRTLAISTLLFIVAGTLVALMDDPFAAQRPGHIWILIVVAVGFPLAERFVFHFEYRREAITSSVAEMPAALALFFISPVAAIALRSIMGVLLIHFAWKSPALKLYFNAAIFSFEMAVAYFLVRAFTSPDTDDVQFLLIVTLALAFTNFVGTLLVSVVISCFEGDPMTRLRQAVRTCLVSVRSPPSSLRSESPRRSFEPNWSSSRSFP